MRNTLVRNNAVLGTAPVFFTTLSTILGAILFLRFGYAVGNVGFWGTVAIIVLGHLVTLPTAMSVAEIATNQKVEGGGAYYIISRSFGLKIGAAIGITLYLSQAISVAFYIVAFAEAFEPLLVWLNNEYQIVITNKQAISVPAMLALTFLMITKGAQIGIKTLYFVVAILLLSIALFFLGRSSGEVGIDSISLTQTASNPDNFFYVFTIIFPAFTGIIAGLGLSGDLKDPKKSIPLGTLLATVVGLLVYFAVAYKLVTSASLEDLANDQLIMSKIALWGPIIPIGLACATISSALGSVMVAPRTLQAIGMDKIVPVKPVNRWLSVVNKDGEPINATILTCVLATFFVLIGDVNFVAEIISMFFMITYGFICLISFLEHFSADPSYRPTFRSKWYISLIGAILCFWLMFQMNVGYAIASLVIMAAIYLWISYYKEEETSGLEAIFQGVIFQISRQLKVFLQKTTQDAPEEKWRPSVVSVSKYSFQRFAAFDLLRWVAYRYGFGTYIHLIEGYLSKETNEEAKDSLGRLIKMAEHTRSNVYLDTLISPSYTSAIAQILQLPGISGKDNNMLLFEFSKNKPEGLEDIFNNFNLIKSIDFDICILGSSDKGFGYKTNIHVWITSKDYNNANLMILLAYITLGHPDWKKGEIKIFASYPENEWEEQRQHLLELITTGRLPISSKNIELLSHKEDTNVKQVINTKSQDADLVVVGFREEIVKDDPIKYFEGYDEVGNVLFVNTTREMRIT